MDELGAKGRAEEVGGDQHGFFKFYTSGCSCPMSVASR